MPRSGVEVHPDNQLDAAVGRVVAQLLAGSRTALVPADRRLREAATRGPKTQPRRVALMVSPLRMGRLSVLEVAASCAGALPRRYHFRNFFR